MLVRKWFGRVAGALASLGLMGAAPAPKARTVGQAIAQLPVQHVARPGLWKLQDRDTIIYLFGTIHALPDNLKWRTPAFDRAFASSDELITEVGDMDDKQALAGQMMKMGLAAGLPPILERVPADKRDALRAAIASSGLPAEVFDKMKSWTAAVVLVGVTFNQIGISSERGVENKLTSDWKARHGKLSGLETVAAQFGFLDSLSADAQQKFLAASAEKPEEVRKQFGEMLKAWETGNEAGIAATFDDETQMSAELREVLMKRRNARWAAWLAERMKRPGTVFVAVGAGHLAGADSVQAMLRARGLKAVRVQ